MIKLCKLAGGLVNGDVSDKRRIVGLKSGFKRRREAKKCSLRCQAKGAQVAFNNRYVAPKRDFYMGERRETDHAKGRLGCWKQDSPDQMLRDAFANPCLTMTSVAKQRPKPYASSRHVTDTKFCICYNMRATLHTNVSSRLRQGGPFAVVQTVSRRNAVQRPHGGAAAVARACQRH